MSAVDHEGVKATTRPQPSHELMRARVRKLIVVGLVTVCYAVALFAFGATADRWWVAVFALLPGALAALGVRASSIPDAPLPGTTAVTVALLTLLFQLLSFALFAWLLFWLVNGLLSLVNLIGGVDIHSESIAFWIAFGCVLMVFTAFSIPSARNLVTALYPAAGLHSPYAGFFREGRMLWGRAGGVAGFVVVVVVLAFLTDIPGYDWGTALFLGLLAASSLVSNPSLLTAVRDEPQVTEDTLANAFRKRGWNVIPSPQTGRASIDPLLAEVDLFAYKDTRSLLVKVTQDAGARSRAAWFGATSVLTACRALPRTELPAGVEMPDAVVFLIDAEADPAVKKLAGNDALSIVNLDLRAHTASIVGADRLRSELKAVADLVVGKDPSTPPADTRAGATA
jgi:hypothetical protein